MLSEQEIIRREKLSKLKELGINPYPANLYPVDTTSKQVEENYQEGKEVVVAGRLMSVRIQGKASFASLQDSEGRVQLYFNRDEICPGEDKTLYNEVFKKLLDLGDFIGVEGTLFTTQVGEKTILVKNFVLLSKVLRPLPMPKVDADGNVYDAFTDPEMRYRMRYVDMVVNPHVKEVFLKRTKLFNAMRQFFNDAGYLEVETPVLQSIPGGASARPFITHHNALDIPLYMRIANELYHWMMDFTEKLLEHCAKAVNGTTKATFGKYEVDFKAPYPRVTMTDAIKQFTGFDITGKSEDELREFAKSIGIEVNETMGKGKLIDEIFGEKCEGNFIQPTFITDYPKEMSPLTKEHRDNPALTERFELMVCGKEIANAYSELNDPIDQRERFEEQLKLSEKGDDEAMFIDQDFLRALEYGMPPTSGLGIGMDRLIMFLTNNESIQEVLFFPQMKPEKKAVELSDDEKIVFELLKQSEKINLEELKAKSTFSNKKWDKTIKGLTAKKIAKVEKEGEELFVILN